MKRHDLLGPAIPASDITPRELFEQRRALIRAAAAGAFGAALAPWISRAAFAQTASPNPSASARRSSPALLPV